MIPIYRAKKIDSDEWVEGYLEELDFDYYITNNGWSNTTDPNTLAIHFPDMIDKNGNKIFASLSEDGVGGDILNDGINDDFLAIFTSKCIRIVKFKTRRCDLYTIANLEVIGIYKGE